MKKHTLDTLEIAFCVKCINAIIDTDKSYPFARKCWLIGCKKLPEWSHEAFLKNKDQLCPLINKRR